MSTITVKDLVKEFNGFTAVDHVSFNVESGELFGLLGPNGAGKTTTINVLATLLRPTSGYAEVAGYDVTKSQDDVRRSIGVVFQEPALDDRLTGWENLEFHAMMYGMGKKEREERINRVLDLVDLTGKADVFVENYSGGMQRRLEIARGLVHRPEVLFLDEPTLGLDAQTRRHIWDYIKELNEESGVTIILTTHYMEEADYLCERIAIIDQGEIIAMDSPKNLKDVLGGDVITLGLNGETGEYAQSLENLEWVKTISEHDGSLNLTVEHGEKRIPEIIGLAHETKVTVDSVNLRKPSLEDVFLHFTGKRIREQEADAKDRMRQRMRARRR